LADAVHCHEPRAGAGGPSYASHVGDRRNNGSARLDQGPLSGAQTATLLLASESLIGEGGRQCFGEWMESLE